MMLSLSRVKKPLTGLGLFLLMITPGSMVLVLLVWMYRRYARSILFGNRSKPLLTAFSANACAEPCHN